MALTRYIIVATIALFLSGTSWAQQQPSPGAVQRSIDRAVTPSVKPEEPAPETEKADQPKRAPVAEGGPRFLVKQFSFRGNGIYGDDELRARIANRQGEKLTLAEIYAVADELTDFYHAQGHSLAVVTVPAQQVKDGQVLLEVVEGMDAREFAPPLVLRFDGILAHRMKHLRAAFDAAIAEARSC